MADETQHAKVCRLHNVSTLLFAISSQAWRLGQLHSSFSSLLGLTPQQNIDLLFNPVFVIGLVRLCVCPVPATQMGEKKKRNI